MHHRPLQTHNTPYTKPQHFSDYFCHIKSWLSCAPDTLLFPRPINTDQDARETQVVRTMGPFTYREAIEDGFAGLEQSHCKIHRNNSQRSQGRRDGPWKHASKQRIFPFSPSPGDIPAFCQYAFRVRL